MADGLSIAASIAGLFTLADAVFVRTFRYVKDAKGAEKEVATLADELQSLSGVLHCLHLRINGLGNDEQDDTATCRPELVGSCLRLLVGVRDKLQEYMPGEHKKKVSGVIKKLKWPFSMTETKNLIRGIERQKSTLTMALSADSMTAAQKILSSQDRLLFGMEEIKNDVERRQKFESSLADSLMAAALEEKQKEVIRFFGTVDPRERYQTSRSLRHPNTGMWLLESDEFQEWLNKRCSRLWLSGIPGAGKTVLASAVIDSAINQYCNDSEKGVAYFYCDYKDDQSQKLQNILGSIAAQLATQNNQSLQILEEHYDMFHSPGKLSVNSVKPSLVQVIQKMSVYFTEVFIIVDALDECGQNVTTVVENLASLNTGDMCNIKTLLLSRDEYAISSCLQSDFVHIPIAARSHDLKLYVASQIETRMNSGKLRIKSPALKDQVMEKLVNGSGGMFRWVACQIDRLGKLPHDTARRRALEDLPPDLDSTYERILSSVNEHDECSRMLVQRTLRWIILAKEPLKTEQLCEALAIEDGSTTIDHDGLPDEEVILDLCSSLIRKSINGDRLELSHFTVEEYLKSPRISSNSSLAVYYIDPVAATLMLSKKCITYLSMDDFCQDLPSTLVAWIDRHNAYPFRIHAVRYWHIYATQYADHFENDCFFSLCQTFFNPDECLKFLSYAQDIWMNEDPFADISNFSVVGQTPLHYAAIHRIVRLQQWLLSCGCDVNNVGPLGSPLHCALVGTESFGLRNFGVNDVLFRANPLDLMKSISLLLHAGADWSIPLKVGQNQLRSTVVASLTLIGMKKEDKASLLKIFLDAGATLGEKDIKELEIYFDKYDHESTSFFEEFQRHNIQESSIGRFLNLASKMKISAPLSWPETKCDPGSRIDLMNPKETAARLRLAARINRTDKISYLLSGPELDINLPTEDNRKTALHIAFSNKSIGAAKLLLNAGADPNQPDCSGNTALHEHARSGTKDSSICALLVRRGGIFGRMNEDGETALDLAVRFNNIDIQRALLTLHEQEGGTLLTPICRVLALKRAVEVSSYDATILLIDHVEDLNYRFAEGKTLAHYCWNSSTEICCLLIERGLDVEATTKTGESALHCFVSRASLDEDEYNEVKMIHLLATAATINLPDSNGMTPAAMLVCRKYYLSSTRLLAMSEALLKHGADFTRTDSSGKAPLDILISQPVGTFNSALIERIAQHVHDVGVAVREDFWTKVLTWTLENRIWNLATITRGNVCNASMHSRLRKTLETSIHEGTYDVCLSLVNSGFRTDLGHSGGSGCNAVIQSLERHRPAFTWALVYGGFSTAGEACCRSAHPGYTPIHLAAACSCRMCCQVLSLLLDRIPPKDDFHMTAPVHPLHIAAARSNTAAIICFLEHYSRSVQGFSFNSNVKSRDEERSSKTNPTVSDSQSHSISPTVKVIVNLHIRDSHLRQPWKLTDHLWTIGLEAATPLHLAALVGDSKSAEILISYGADVHGLSGSNETPLHLAAGIGSISMVRLLLRHGAKVDARNSMYRTPALVAAMKGSWAVFQELVGAGSDLTLRDEHHDGFADSIIRRPEKPIFDLYLENASVVDRVSAPQTVNRSALWWACGFHTPALFSCLLNREELQMDPESVSSIGGCRLITRNRNALLRMLLKWLPEDCPAMGSINKRKPYGAHSPLCVAASVCNIDGMRLLLDFGADVDYEGHEDGTPLMVACKAGHLRAVEFLVRQGACISYCRGTEICNALSHAERYPDIKEWLLVGRYTQQRKIDVATEADASERVCQQWAGLMKVEVPLIARYGQFAEESLLQYAIRLAQYKRDFEGYVLRWGDDVPIPFITLSL